MVYISNLAHHMILINVEVQKTTVKQTGLDNHFLLFAISSMLCSKYVCKVSTVIGEITLTSLSQNIPSSIHRDAV